MPLAGLVYFYTPFRGKIWRDSWRFSFKKHHIFPESMDYASYKTSSFSMEMRTSTDSTFELNCGDRAKNYGSYSTYLQKNNATVEWLITKMMPNEINELHSLHICPIIWLRFVIKCTCITQADICAFWQTTILYQLKSIRVYCFRISFKMDVEIGRQFKKNSLNLPLDLNEWPANIYYRHIRAISEKMWNFSFWGIEWRKNSLFSLLVH